MVARVNITTAAKLTGRSEKTIRAWLAEDPCPLSIEWGQFRGGRRQGASVRKGRTRLLDVDELHALHVARGGTEWHDRFVPVPDVRSLVARIEVLEAQLAALRGQRSWLFASPSEHGQPGIASMRVSAPQDALDAPEQRERPQRPASAATARDTLPEGWVAVSTWCRPERHNVNYRSAQRSWEGHDSAPYMPKPERAPENEPWIHHGQRIRTAYTPEQHRIACAVAAIKWPERFRSSCGPDCPSQSEAAAHEEHVASGASAATPAASSVLR